MFMLRRRALIIKKVGAIRSTTLEISILLNHAEDNAIFSIP